MLSVELKEWDSEYVVEGVSAGGMVRDNEKDCVADVVSVPLDLVKVTLRVPCVSVGWDKEVEYVPV